MDSCKGVKVEDSLGCLFHIFKEIHQARVEHELAFVEDFLEEVCWAGVMTLDVLGARTSPSSSRLREQRVSELLAMVSLHGSESPVKRGSLGGVMGSAVGIVGGNSRRSFHVPIGQHLRLEQWIST